MAALVVVIFALDREAAPFRRLARRHRLPVRILVSGVGAVAVRNAMQSVGDAALVISAGFCGALDPELKIGDVAVCKFGGEAEALRSGTRDLASALGSEDSASRLNLVTVDHLVATPDAKRRLREQTGADVVDMEASHVRAICDSHGLPFMAVKAVSDTAATALSPDLVRLLADGAVSPRRACAAVLRRPTILFEFRRLARDTRCAAERLAEQLAAILQKFLVPA